MIELDGVRDNFPVRIRKNRNFQDFIDGITLTAIAALIVVVIMLYITTISFSTDFSLKQIGFEGVILYFATISISILSRAYARRKGRNTKQYAHAFERVEANNQAIIDNGYSAKASTYCRKWEEEELRSSRLKVLSCVGISVDDFENKYVKYNKRELTAKYPELSKDEIKTILTAKKIKRLRYDESYLTVSDKVYGRHSPSGGFKTRTVDKINTAQLFITGAVSCGFSASLVMEVVADPSWATIVTCAIKVIMIIIFGVFGIVNGYNLSAVRETRELVEKADEQARFIKWCGGTNYGTNTEKLSETIQN